MTPGISPSHMPPYPKESTGLWPICDSVPTMLEPTDNPVSTSSSTKNLQVLAPHHLYHPLPADGKPLVPAVPPFLPDLQGRDKLDLRGYSCYKLAKEELLRRGLELGVDDSGIGGQSTTCTCICVANEPSSSSGTGTGGGTMATNTSSQAAAPAPPAPKAESKVEFRENKDKGKDKGKEKGKGK